jgi:2',3'-cyclic-nucleotide 2'-phosphodiesterase/3'-nucleotidase
VLLDGGDWFQGTMISNLAFGRPVVEQMNALGYAAAAIGNHEFDWGADTLARRVRELRFAALGANMHERKNGKLPRWARSDTTFTRRGLRVGVLGLCYPQTPTVTMPSNVAYLRFDDDSATAAPIAQRLRKNHADVVIGVGHIPAATDSARRPRGDIARLARGVPGVDVWLGGHSHNQVAGDVNGVPALIAGSHGQFVAVCDLVVDPVAHKALEHRAWLEPTYADAITPDSVMAARVATWNGDVSQIAAEPIGRSTTTITRSSPENLVGNLVTDAIRSEMKLDVVFQNSGGLRADLPSGVITRGMIYEVMPFDNTVVTMKLSGREVRQALEEGLRSGRVSQVSGIRYAYDLDAPPMHRVVDVTLADGKPLDPDRDYAAAVNNFMAQGGDDYDLFRTARDKVDTQVSVREQLEAYVRDRSKNGGSLDLKPEGRIRREAAAQR